STDASTRDSADRTIIAWDFRTSAKISNQIFHERFTCPSLALHPREPVFLAQTNGNYLALFSTVWPYRMSRRRRYEGHKVLLSLYPRRMLSPSPKPPGSPGYGPWGAWSLCLGGSCFLFPG
ncbi:WDR25 isoform 10, partial [Pongo abelii]